MESLRSRDAVDSRDRQMLAVWWRGKLEATGGNPLQKQEQEAYITFWSSATECLIGEEGRSDQIAAIQKAIRFSEEYKLFTPRNGVGKCFDLRLQYLNKELKRLGVEERK